MIINVVIVQNQHEIKVNVLKSLPKRMEKVEEEAQLWKFGVD
jgi:hypothetical protein